MPNFFQTEPEASVVDLARLNKKPNEKETQFINRFKRVRTKCKLVIPKTQFVKLAQKWAQI